MILLQKICLMVRNINLQEQLRIEMEIMNLKRLDIGLDGDIELLQVEMEHH